MKDTVHTGSTELYRSHSRWRQLLSRAQHAKGCIQRHSLTSRWEPRAVVHFEMNAATQLTTAHTAFRPAAREVRGECLGVVCRRVSRSAKRRCRVTTLGFKYREKWKWKWILMEVSQSQSGAHIKKKLPNNFVARTF